ncbi:Thymus-specific serine protease [Perkinsus chesapeaki]|uniref:Thymus-specific serine protease n=1 Tax=Perkinsus chesapeaki TaxID=330153 RepID=A0A7J6MQE0_PERCH|nr:Thymus-specific serine protease [Perkinsus chesapeaki]
MIKTTTAFIFVTIQIAVQINCGLGIVSWNKADFEGQLVDHEAGPAGGTFRQRGLINTQFYNPKKPVLFLCVAQEATTSSAGYEMIVPAIKNNAVMMVLEHRFFGQSLPTKDFSAATLEKLHTVHQALEDLRYAAAKQVPQLLRPKGDLKILLFGYSYTGTLAAWARQQYPTSVTGAVASSSPFDIKVANDAYNSVAAADFERYDLGGSSACLSEVTKAHQAFSDALGSPEGQQKLEGTFRICRGNLATKNNQFLAAGSSALLGVPIQYNDPACQGKYCNIAKICERFTSGGDAPLEKLADIFNTNKPLKSDTDCHQYDWENTMKQ